MLNSNTYHGVDGSLTIAADYGVTNTELEAYFGNNSVVGRVTNITLSVTTVVKPFHEIGSHAPKELRAGNISIEGTVERAFMNGALLKLMLGKYSEGEVAGPDKEINMPEFIMTVALDNKKQINDEDANILTVHGVMFDAWQFNLPEDDFVLERAHFRAKRIMFAPNAVSAAASAQA